ncbi:RES domain protein [Caballeronia terrestris]|uniref:RES domain protein n=1 Tax=Caballeronia terrestris TaxID=1226301 RepID=A0A158KSN5_9BURK|nr:RES domain-containing protein [Caballeronia terrestris]SAL83743.1 RES domain protein [Caballeronia terrestris]
MSDNHKLIAEPPQYVRDRLPSPEQLRECFCNEPFAEVGDAQVFRAAYVPESVLPKHVKRAYRFGPPSELIAKDGTMPFWWLYAAHNVETCIWEAQFCKNDVRRPGTFYMDPYAVEHGIIAELRFPRPLRLWNLNGSISSRLGIFDELSSPDYEWCQWFGTYMDIAIEAVNETMRPDGFVYPSRRHRGFTAIAVSSRVLPTLRDGIVRTDMPFSKHPDFERLTYDHLKVAAPEQDAV